MTMTKKQFRVGRKELQLLKESAAAGYGASVSALVRAWIEDIAESGSGMGEAPVASESTKLQVFVDSEVLAKAEAACLAEGRSLKQIIDQRIADLKPDTTGN
ncbi:MAG: hypothetical protein RL430_2103 [Actinomycetota bacterium]|jgi:predicted HicB family RNase H-like nuclease